MKGLSPEERRDALKALIDTETQDLPLIDRSTAEHWSVCPWAGNEIEQGRSKIVGMAAESGNAVHAALSCIVQSYIDSNGVQSPTDLRQDLEFELRRARPDLQPDVLKACMPSVWAWSKFLGDIHPGNILRFDGGEGGRSGQLAYDIPDMGVRLTSEVDLLVSTPSIEVLDEYDWKGGHTPWTYEDVADAFQFQVHGLLALKNYPAVNALNIRVWCTRMNRVTHAVMFSRNRLADYEFRVRSALEIRARHWDNPPAWPTSEKCPQCPVAARCPVAEAPIGSDPVDVLRDLIAVEAKADALKKVLTAHVDSTGADVRFNGTAFGRNKPSTERKKPVSIYELKE